ncbi:lamin tail domain-containing protein [Candidatus Peregrinibacteria bacterium]|nr:lamin tail domain-containing protein [Candidatus Peregrinibacteria bacterium]
MSAILGLLTINPVFASYNANDVVINEVAWAGTTDNSNDEWLELYNNTSQPIDLTNWYVEDDDSSKYVIQTGEIPAHGYFLIEDSEISTNVKANAVIGLSLANAGDKLILKAPDGTAIDNVNLSGGAWYAGDAASKATMERINPALSGDVKENWASATLSNGAIGRTGGEILGTPLSANSAYAGQGATVSILPPDIKANKGDTVKFSVDINEVANLYAYGFEFNYDSQVLSFVSATESNFLKVDGKPTAFNSGLQDGQEGTLVVGGARLVNPPNGVDGSGKLFEVSFKIKDTTATSTAVNFGANSFLSDASGDTPVKLKGTNISIGNNVIPSVQNAKFTLGADRYSLKLTWDKSPDEGVTYTVKKKNFDGTYKVLKDTSDGFFADNLNIVPNFSYTYQIIAVKNGVASQPADVIAVETRGINGDIDRSDRVDGRDIEKLARSYGSENGDEEYDPLKDVNFDGIIDGKDLISIGANFGVRFVDSN